MSNDNGWSEHKLLVLHEIARLDARISLAATDLKDSLEKIHVEIRALRDDQIATREDVAGLKVQASVVGGIAGLISSFIGYFIPKP